MVDHYAALNANMAILITAVTNLTVAVHEHISICQAAYIKPDAQDFDHAAALADLSLTPLPTSRSASPQPAPQPDSDSTGNSPDVVRQYLAAMKGPTQGPWYIVTVGQKPGVYRHISEVAHLTSGISGNAYKKHLSQSAAIQAYERAWNLGAVKCVV